MASSSGGAKTEMSKPRKKSPKQRAMLRAWIKALRSGKYKQGHKALSTADNYCCLGVLCDVAAPERWKGQQHDNLVYVASSRVRRMVGLSAYEQCNLIDLNDVYGKGFRAIANYIEKHILRARPKKKAPK